MWQHFFNKHCYLGIFLSTPKWRYSSLLESSSIKLLVYDSWISWSFNKWWWKHTRWGTGEVAPLVNTIDYTGRQQSSRNTTHYLSVSILCHLTEWTASTKLTRTKRNEGHYIKSKYLTTDFRNLTLIALKVFERFDWKTFFR